MRRWGWRGGVGYSRVGGRGGPESYYRASSFHYRNIKARVHSVAKSEGRMCRFLVVTGCRCSLGPHITTCSSRIARSARTPLISCRKFRPSFGPPLLVPFTNRSPSLYKAFSVVKRGPLDVLKMMMGSMICSITMGCQEHQRNAASSPNVMTRAREDNILGR